MTDAAQTTAPRATFGTIGFFLGVAALILVVVSFTAGPFAPQQATGVTLGELASEIGKSALRETLGLEQPAPAARPWDIDRVLHVVGIVAGVIATMFAAWGFTRGESRRMATVAGMFGMSAVALQVFATALFAILGALVIIAIIGALQGVFSDIFSF